MLRQVVEVPQDIIRPLKWKSERKRYVARGIVQCGKLVGWRWYVFVRIIPNVRNTRGSDRPFTGAAYRFVRYEWTPKPGSR